MIAGDQRCGGRRLQGDQHLRRASSTTLPRPTEIAQLNQGRGLRDEQGDARRLRRRQHREPQLHHRGLVAGGVHQRPGGRLHQRRGDRQLGPPQHASAASARSSPCRRPVRRSRRSGPGARSTTWTGRRSRPRSWRPPPRSCASLVPAATVATVRSALQGTRPPPGPGRSQRLLRLRARERRRGVGRPGDEPGYGPQPQPTRAHGEPGGDDTSRAPALGALDGRSRDRLPVRVAGWRHAHHHGRLRRRGAARRTAP